MAKMLKNLYWIEDLLPKESIKKSMFGGFGYYLEQKLILVLFEGEGQRTYKNKKYDFEIWNGCMFPVEPALQAGVLSKYDFLISHPVLPKWLYLPLETDDFESKVEMVMRQLRRRNSAFGTIPKEKKPRNRSAKVKAGSSALREKINMKKPRMFRDEPAEAVLKSASRISDLKNLGPTAEKHFHAVGIKSAQQFIKLGWKKSLTKLAEHDLKHAHSLYAYALIGALTNIEWNQISEGEKAEARQFTTSLRSKLKKK